MTVINTGGTFNKRYDPLSGELVVPKDNRAVEAIFACFTYAVTLTGMLYKDSLEMDEADREAIGTAVSALSDKTVVIIHGTDTMDKTADYLASLDLDKVIVLTGAMVPFGIDPVEATANLSMAMGLAEANEKSGVYICMQGVFAPCDAIAKNRTTGKFERV